MSAEAHRYECLYFLLYPLEQECSKSMDPHRSCYIDITGGCTYGTAHHYIPSLAYRQVAGDNKTILQAPEVIGLQYFNTSAANLETSVYYLTRNVDIGSEERT